jgi:hypothetical protein
MDRSVRMVLPRQLGRSVQKVPKGHREIRWAPMGLTDPTGPTGPTVPKDLSDLSDL